MKFKTFINSKVDYLKTICWNLFAPNLYKHLLKRYNELMEALDERDREYETDITLADETARRLKEENKKLAAENERLHMKLHSIAETLTRDES